MGLNSNFELKEAVSNLQRKYNNLCCYIRKCLGISSIGDEDLFLNQKGQWTEVGGGNSWSLQGNTGTDQTTDFVGTTDGEPLIIQPDGSDVGIGTNTPNGFEINKALGGDSIGKFIIDDDIFGFPLNLMFAGFGSPDGEYWGMAETVDDTLERGIADIGWKNQNTQDSRHIKLGNNDVGEYPADDGRFLVIEAYDTTPFARGKYNFRPHSIDINFDSGDPGEERYDINLFDNIADDKLLMMQNGKTEMNFVTVSEILSTLPTYLNDAAAAGGGLAVGDSYFSTTLSAYTRRLI